MVRTILLATFLGFLLVSCAGKPKVPPPPSPTAEQQTEKETKQDQEPEVALGMVTEAADSARVFASDDLYETQNNWEDLLQSIAASQGFFAKKPKLEYEYGDQRYSGAELIESLELFKTTLLEADNSADFLAAFHEKFMVLQSPGADENGSVLFTGYYEPLISVSSKKSQEFATPAYTKPKDLRSIRLEQFRPELRGHSIVYRLDGQKPVPYYSRREIMQNQVLANKASPIAWFTDPVDLFFLQIQGSGTVVFEDGSQARLGYAGSNGRPYSSIGKLLIAEGVLSAETASMQSIRQYLKDNPQEIERVLYHNQSYTFFEKQPIKHGPLGSINVHLTPQRSIATDYRIFPKGALAFIRTKVPNCNDAGLCQGTKEVRRFVLNQDTGGAIRGFGRADLFWGLGAQAEASAGKMNYSGELYFIVAKKEYLSTAGETSATQG